MGKIIYKSAGAGSGKTYFLTHNMADLLKKSGVTGSNMIVTTFTKAAAADIRTKAKKVLYDDPVLSGRAEELDSALMGTVHSIANTFLNRYWYKARISPELRVLDEDATKVYLSESLADPKFVSSSDRAFFNRFREKLGITCTRNGLTLPNYRFWQEDVEKLVGKISAYSMESKEIDDSKAYSLKLLDEILGKGTALPCAQDLLVAADRLINAVENNVFTINKSGANKGKRKSQDKYDALVALVDELKSGITSAGTVDKSMIYDFYGLFSLQEGAPLTLANIEKINAADPTIISLVLPYQYTECIRDLRDDTVLYIEKIYTIAVDFISRYKEFKEKMHYIDYDALEDEFYKLLDDDDVKKDIRDQYKYVMVDEFQDSSPKQIEIFKKLAELSEESYWVGDKKQAIYGFRGTNSDLVQSVVDTVPDEVSSLKDSYRSVKALVDASNIVFCHLFDAVEELDPDFEGEKMVYLNCGRTAKFDKEHNLPQPLLPKNLYQWSDAVEPSVLAKRIAALLKGEGCIDSVDGSPQPKDIAVLARTNKELDGLCAELRGLGIPVNIAGEKISETDEAKIACAALRLLDEPDNGTMAAIIAKALIPGYSTNDIISKRTLSRMNSAEWLAGEEIIKTIKDLSFEARSLSISQMLEKIFVSINLYDRVKGLGNAETRKNNLITLCELAGDFEDRCAQLAIPATIGGFIYYLENNEKKNSGDKSGVTLTTYHSSKGLEWPIVILTSLDHTYLDEENIIGRCMMSGVKDFSEKGNTSVFLMRKLFDLPSKSNPRYDVASLVSNIKKTEAYRVISDSEKEESKRRFYVGFTRAMNTLILAGDDFAGVSEMGIDIMNTELGLNFEVVDGEPETTDLVYGGLNDTRCVDRYGKKSYALRDYHPSELEEGKAPSRFGNMVVNAQYQQAEYLGSPSDRIVSTSKQEDNIFGDCIHHIFGVPEVLASDPVERITGIAGQYGVTFKSVEHVALAWKRLEEYLNKRFPNIVKMYHELPFRYKDSEGHIFSGSMDLVVETSDGFFIVDYKTYQGTDLIEHTKEKRYAAQLFCYAEALKQFYPEKSILGTAIYYPVTQAVVELKLS